jgi:hypothetical protein
MAASQTARVAEAERIEKLPEVMGLLRNEVQPRLKDFANRHTSNRSVKCAFLD